MDCNMKVKARKAQVSADAIVIFAFVLLLFMFALHSALNKQVHAEEIKDTFGLREACMKISNIISSVYASGNGTIATIRLDYYLTLPGNGSIVLSESVNLSEIPEQQIAILASEAGPTSQAFYSNMTARASPDWYKACFSDIGSGVGCQDWTTECMNQSTWDSITGKLNDLMGELHNNPTYYDTVYLEDPHIQFFGNYSGIDYMSILRNWVAQGKVLIMAEHIRCRDSNGIFDAMSYRCDPVSPDWEVLDVEHHQTGQQKWIEIVNESDIFDFTIGQSFKIDEANYLTNLGAEEYRPIAKYQGGGETVIAQWKLGKGMVYYFGDFQLQDHQDNDVNQTEYTQILTKIIEEAYYLLNFTSSAESCSVPVDTRAYENLYGMIKFENDNGRIMAEIVGE